MKNKFTFSWKDSNGKTKQCFCIGAGNCSEINCPLVEAKLDKVEKSHRESLWEDIKE